MILPIGDDQVRGGHRPVVSYLLLAANILVFFWELSASAAGFDMLSQYGAIPVYITNGERLFTLFTSMFLHGGYMHIIGNMLFLWVFADNIEAIIGNFRFLIFYLTGGLLAAALQILLDPGSPVPMVGASGAISAVIGAYLLMFPKSRVRVNIFIIFNVYLPAFLFLGFWAVQQFMNGYASLGTTSEGGGVAWFAHIGGLLYGIWFGLRNRGRVSSHYEDSEYV